MAKALKVRYFKLLIGCHAEKKETYHAGAVIATASDLVTMFGVDKFKEVSERYAKKVSPPPPPPPPKADEIDPVEENEEELIDEDDLEDNGDEEEEEEKKAPAVVAKASKLGKDVSAEYKLATDNDLLVLQKGLQFFVAEADSPDVKKNASKLTSKKAVEKFITDLVK